MRAHSSAIVVGGVGSTEESMRPLCMALERYFPDDIYPISLRKAVNDERLADKLKGRPVITHSAGATAVDQAVRSSGALPSEVVSIGPPTGNITAFGLISASLPKSYHLARRNRQEGDESAVWSYQMATGTEIALHPKFTINMLRCVAQHSVLETASWMATQGVASKLVWHHDDSYFRPDISTVNAVEQNSFITVQLLAGEHDEALVRPLNVIPYVFDDRCT